MRPPRYVALPSNVHYTASAYPDSEHGSQPQYSATSVSQYESATTNTYTGETGSRPNHTVVWGQNSEVYSGSEMYSGSTAPTSHTVVWDPNSEMYPESTAPTLYAAPSVASTQDYPRYDQDYPHEAGRLPCEFVGLSRCEDSYALTEQKPWREHIVNGHFNNKLPAKCICWYCSAEFDSDKTSDGDRKANFKKRMRHIYDHISTGGMTAWHMRPDYFVLKHLQKHELINQTEFDQGMRFQEAGLTTRYEPPDFEYPETLAKQERAQLEPIDIRKEERDRRKAAEKEKKAREDQRSETHRSSEGHRRSEGHRASEGHRRSEGHRGSEGHRRGEDRTGSRR